LAITHTGKRLNDGYGKFRSFLQRTPQTLPKKFWVRKETINRRDLLSPQSSESALQVIKRVVVDWNFYLEEPAQNHLQYLLLFQLKH
jgi:hypothetical protein